MAAVAAPSPPEGRGASRPVNAAGATTRAHGLVRDQGARPRNPGCEASSPFDHRATLESTVLAAWESVVVEGRCACPVCGGTMAAGGAGATCSDCGSLFA
jgi:DnaJ-class molecular chaperone